ncbi:MAG: DoxX family protein [Hyphomicrobium sp.]|uniref:DoxX family protein n=1 Tax=Hyphomicrobium sp. TaxID=82 RepID=UPI0013227311|nr:DoxX family protein [Hyphomicrobium sp.]KAB2940169.1 MAG: DoxX family protein [Hyphomicrobium sp.]MBZ0210459.1 DoxX family protein [Hyphomicrobium sp.]MCZ7595301.1 DoxX family protein [Hyphomicrobium sp.]
MRDLANTTIAAFKAIPDDLIAYIARISVGTVFFRSGLLKLEGWADGNTLTLFREEYRLPLIPPEIAAYMATAAELTLPLLLFAGLLTRFAAAALLVMTLVIEIFVYPNAFDTHGVWAVCLLFLMKYGAGALSLDNALGRYWSSPGEHRMS